MADDPRIEPLAEKMLSDHQAEHDWTSMTWQDYAADAVELLAVADKHDRWRALLADEDRAVEGLGQLVYNVAVDHPMWLGDDGQSLEYLPAREALIGQFIDDAARAVLAALREVAGL